MKSFISLLLILILSGFIISAQPFKVSAASDLVRVFEDGYNLPPLEDSIKIFGIRGEIISGQFTIHALSDLTKVTVDVSALKNRISGRTLPTESVNSVQIHMILRIVFEIIPVSFFCHFFRR